MPFESEAQRRYMFAKMPETAERWAEHTPKGKKLPERVDSEKSGVLRDYGKEGKEELRDREWAFKAGFLCKVAELGVTPDEFHALVKAALEPLMSLTGIGGVGLGAAYGLGTDAARVGLYGAGLAPIIGGALTGGLEAKLTSPSVEDIEALRRAELTAKYERMTREIRSRMSRRQA